LGEQIVLVQIVVVQNRLQHEILLVAVEPFSETSMRWPSIWTRKSRNVSK
jgi:hypothetical protein